jgi:hypothetical protein
MPQTPIQQLAWGWIYPYHDQEPKDRYEQIVCAIISDLTDRGGIKQGFVDIDEDIRVEIVETLASYVKAGIEAEDLPKLSGFAEYMDWKKGVA